MERPTINNAFYQQLDEKWLKAIDHPIALLRAENRLRNPWIAEMIQKEKKETSRILDVGCGAGFLTNYLSSQGHEVHGVDLSASSLEIARSSDPTGSVTYTCASGYALPYSDASFDIICAMDFLEHVEKPDQIIQEIGRLLKPGGLFFFHTFSRTFWSWLLVIKGVAWCVDNAPEHMHVFHLFLNPSEVRDFCKKEDMEVFSMRGIQPAFRSRSFLKMIVTGKVDDDFTFEFTSSLRTGYVGIAKKN